MVEHDPSRQGSKESTENTSGEGGVTEGKPQALGSIGQEALRPGLTMQNELQTRKTRGRLTRDVQGKLGRTLQAYFDDVVKEGVPDRFKDLLKQIDERNGKDKGSA